MAAETAPGGLPSGSYSTHDVRPQDRFDHWHAHMSAVCEMAPPGEGTDAPYLVQSTKWMFDGVLMIAGDYPEINMERQPRHVRADQLDHYNLKLRPTQVQQIDADGHRSMAMQLQPVLTDMSRPDAFHWESGRSITMYLPREAMDGVLARPLDLHGVVPQGAAARMLAEHLLTLESILPHMTPAEAPGAKLATLHLLAASLAPTAQSLALARPALEQGLGRMARRYIETHLRDEDLTADRICGHFKVSRSTIYRVFEPLGGIAGYIRERRLARIHALLASPEQRKYIGRIAEDHGFRSPTQFSRAFRAQFGYSPREVQGRGGPALQTGVAARDLRSASFENWVQAVRE